MQATNVPEELESHKKAEQEADGSSVFHSHGLSPPETSKAGVWEMCALWKLGLSL